MSPTWETIPGPLCTYWKRRKAGRAWERGYPDPPQCYFLHTQLVKHFVRSNFHSVPLSSISGYAHGNHYCRDLNLLDQKWVRTWCRMHEIGMKMGEACWTDCQVSFDVLFSLLTRVYGTPNALLNYCQFEPTIMHLHYEKAVPMLAFVAFIFVVRGGGAIYIIAVKVSRVQA